MKASYNQRLFTGRGLRSWYHLSRFYWLKRHVDVFTGKKKIIELGCFDGRSLDYISREKIEFYHGYDAGWEGGLGIALNNKKSEKINFTKAVSAADINPNESFNLFIALETLEHLDDSELNHYLTKIRSQLERNYNIIISVPNEIGVLFLVKTILKWVIYRDGNGYTIREVFWQTLGRTEFVKRNEHKGFSHRKLCKVLEEIFGQKITMVGVQFPGFPLFLNPSIGLVLR